VCEYTYSAAGVKRSRILTSPSQDERETSLQENLSVGGQRAAHTEWTPGWPGRRAKRFAWT